MADYNPKARRPRTQVPADEPAPVDALLEAVEHLHDDVTAAEPAAVGPDAGPAVPDAAVAPPAANPWVSSVPAAPERSRRVVLVVAAVVAAAVAIVIASRRRRRRR